MVNLLFVLGVVVATIGAAGFEAPFDLQAAAGQARSTEPFLTRCHQHPREVSRGRLGIKEARRGCRLNSSK